MQQENLRLEDLLGKTKTENISDGDINSVAIIGAGIMGQGIAHTIAAAGLEVIIIEKDLEHLEKARHDLTESIDREIKRWAITRSEKKSILSRIAWEVSLDKIREFDLIIEAVDEDFNLKQLIFSDLDEHAKKETIFASNTSTLSLTKLAETTKRPDKIIGMHFLFPVPKIPLVELIKCLHTSNETVTSVKAFAAKIGKTAV